MKTQSDEPIYDKQVKKILEGLSDGKQKEVLAAELGYSNPVSLDNYMRRRNFSWDSRQNTFIPAKEKHNQLVTPLSIPHRNSKVAKVISLFSKDGADAREIAKEMDFNNHCQLGDYMKEKGYTWSAAENNYVRSSLDGAMLEEVEEDCTKLFSENSSQVEHVLSSTDASGYESFLLMLYQNREKLVRLIDTVSEGGTITRYAVPGMLRTKSVHMSCLLDQLTKDFSEEKNISQRDLFEVAIIEFFKRNGYEKQVEKLLKS